MWVSLGAKSWQDAGLENMQKNITNKVPTYAKIIVKNGVPESGRFVVFLGLGPQALHGGPKDLPRHSPMSNFVENWQERCVQTNISTMF